MNTAIIIVTVVVVLAIIGALFITALLLEIGASIANGEDEKTDSTDQE